MKYTDNNTLLVQARTDWCDNTRDETRMTNLNLGFLRVATICNASGIGFSIIDFNNGGDNYSKIKSVLSNKKVALAIISLDIKSIKNAYDISCFIKKEEPDIKIMWCSLGIGFYIPFAVLFKETVLKSEFVDYVLHGSENDLSRFFAEFFSRVDNFTAAGIGYKLRNELIFNPLSQNNGQYIAEDYTAVDMQDYIWRWGREFLSPVYVKKQKIIPVSTGIGCAYSCSFCINSNKTWKEKYRIKPKELLLSQLEFLAKNYGPEVIWFQDDNFFINKERAQEALEFLNQKGIKWAGQGRLNCFRDDYINESFFKDYISPGALWFGVGFETFSDNLRQKLNKRVTRAQLENSAYLCDKYNVPFNPALIFGLTEQTKEELKADVLQLIEFHKKFPKTTFTYQLWRPYPGTQEYKKLEEKGMGIKLPATIKEWLNFDYFDKQERFLWLQENGLSKLMPYNMILVYRFCNAYNKFGKTLLDRVLFPLLKKEFIKERFFTFKIVNFFYVLKKILSKKLSYLATLKSFPLKHAAHRRTVKQPAINHLYQTKDPKLAEATGLLGRKKVLRILRLGPSGSCSNILTKYGSLDVFLQDALNGHSEFNIRFCPSGTFDGYLRLRHNFLIYEIKKRNILYSLIKVFFTVLKLVDKYKINILHSNDPYFFALPLLLVSKIKRIPFCVSIHADYEKNELLQNNFKHRSMFLLRFKRIVERHVCSQADIVLPISNYIKKVIEERFTLRKKLKIFPHGIDIQHIFRPLDKTLLERYNLDSNKKLVMASCRFEKENYIYDYVSLADELIKRKMEDFVFLICGNGSEFRNIQERISKSSLKDFLLLLGFVPNQDIKELKRLAYANIEFLSGLSLLESCVSGRPVVAYDVEWHSEIIEDGKTGFLVCPQDIIGAAEKIAFLFDNPVLAKTIGENAQNFTRQNFSLESVGLKKAIIYDEIIFSRRAEKNN
jgi:glycosyltransferase involved in cell wall biosynthesis/radical SAM superfamily enzyme YgiQ (UPF0313 family)